MADIQFARINDKFALAYDKHQWVLQRGSKRHGMDDWKAIAFIKQSKFHLFSVMIREGVPKDDALDVCEKLPETFTEFLALEGANGVRGASGSAISVADDVPAPKHLPRAHAGETHEDMTCTDIETDNFRPIRIIPGKGHIGPGIATPGQ